MQQPGNAVAGSRRIGVKTAKPGVDYSSYEKNWSALG